MYGQLCLLLLEMYSVFNQSEAFGQDLSSIQQFVLMKSETQTKENMQGCLLQSYWNKEQISNLNVTFYGKKKM